MLRKTSAIALMFCGFIFVSDASFAQVAEQTQPAAVSATTLDEEIAWMRSDLRSTRKLSQPI
jgi:hypothetical protein